jgi:glycine/D-amino acid oxidase-like deaminating enzyme
MIGGLPGTKSHLQGDEQNLMTFHGNFKEIPYWLDPQPLSKSYAGIPLPAKTEVLVIGGGYTGTTAAIRLKQAGVEVVLIDAEKLGTTASGRNGGMTLTGLSKGLETIEKKLGREKAQQLFRESIASVDAVERLVAEGNIDCDFHRYGHLEAAFKPSHFENLKRDQERLNTQFNHETRLLSAAELKTEIDSPLYHGALLDPMSAGVHPARYIAGLVKMADSCGVGLHEMVTAETIERRGTGLTVGTTRGAIDAGDVVVATNGYTSRLTPWLQRRVIPTVSMMIATEILPDDLAQSIIPNGRMIWDTKILLFYFRLSPDGKRLLFGGRPRSPKKTLRENATHMYRGMLSVYPQLNGIGLDYAWSGYVGFTLDRSPHIGRKDGIYYSLGYCGHGVALATYLGEKLAQMVQGHEANTGFADLPFKAFPFYGVKEWFRPLVYAYFSMMDRWF